MLALSPNRQTIRQSPRRPKLQISQSGYGMNRNDAYAGGGNYSESTLVMKRKGAQRHKGHKFTAATNGNLPARGVRDCLL